VGRAEGVAETFIAAVLLLHERSVDGIVAKLQALDRRHDQGKPIREVVAVLGEQLDAAVGIPPGQDAKAVVLDLVYPTRAARRFLGGSRQAGRDGSGSETTAARHFLTLSRHPTR